MITHNMKQSLLIFTFYLVSAYCAIGIEYTRVSRTERAQGFSCKSSGPDLGLMRAEETRVRPNHCAKYTCAIDGTIRAVMCGSIGGPPGCKTVSDMSKLFPDCCPQIVC